MIFRKYFRHAAFGLLTGFILFSLIPLAVAERKESIIHNFEYATGNIPGTNPVIDSSTGIFYGTTTKGGTNNTGLVYKLVPPDAIHSHWIYSVIYNFSSDVNIGLTQPLTVSSGVVYVVVYQSGLPACYKTGCGEVLALTPPAHSGAWTTTVLHQFTGGSQGNMPSGPLVMDSHGFLYGVAQNGGSGCKKRGGCGMTFKLTPPAIAGQAWDFTIVYQSSGGNTLTVPYGGLVIDGSDNLYGVANFDQDGSKEVIYKLAPPSGPGGWVETNLYNFYAGSQNCGLSAPLAIDANGALYGIVGGSCSYAFQLAPSLADPNVWIKTKMRCFIEDGNNQIPNAPVDVDASGNVYGVTYSGGTIGGTVYMLAPRPGVPGKWNYKLLFTFASQDTGYEPLGGVTHDSAGAIYGTTESGGTARRGVLYRLSP